MSARRPTRETLIFHGVCAAILAAEIALIFLTMPEPGEPSFWIWW